MVQDEIQKLLDSGNKIIQYNYSFGIRYFIEYNNSEVHLDTRLFSKLKSQCKNRDESNKKSWYYWK